MFVKVHATGGRWGMLSLAEGRQDNYSLRRMRVNKSLFPIRREVY